MNFGSFLLKVFRKLQGQFAALVRRANLPELHGPASNCVRQRRVAAEDHA